MPIPSSSRPTGLRRAVLLTGGSIAGAAALVRWERSRAGAPWDPSSEQYPSGDDLIVATADGAELHVTVAGPADGPTVVLAHCWMGRRAIWGPVARRLVDGGHRVVLYDQRGHGASTVGARPLSIPMLGDDLAAVATAVDARDAVFAGHSMGGMTVQSYLNEHATDFKERARAVVLVSTAAIVSTRALPARRGGRAVRSERRPSPQGLLTYATSRIAFGRSPRRGDVELTAQAVASTPRVVRDGFLAAMSTMDLRPALSTIDVPSTVLVGSRDLLTPPRMARVLVREIPGAKIELLPGAGHMLPLEAPDAVATAIRAIA